MSVPVTGCIPEVDLHCHLLPHWDDGPQAVEDSLRLAKKAADFGVKKILVTPHVGRSFGTRAEPPSGNIADAVAQLQEQLNHAEIGIELVPGAELTLSSIDFVKRIIDEPWLAFGHQQKYVLVESPFHFWPEWAEQVIFDLSLQNITPIIAHPERLTDVQKDPEYLRPFVERGALLQITARSLITSQREIKKSTSQLLKTGMVSVVASDAHSSRHVMSREVETEIVEIIGEGAAQQILVENPRAVLSGDALKSPLPPTPSRKKGIFSFFNRS